MLKPTNAGLERIAATATASAPSVRGALASLSLSMLLSSLSTSIANIALPTLSQALAAPFQEVQWVVLAYLLSVTGLIVGAGRLGDVIGPRRLLLAGLLLFTAASAFCGAAPTLSVLIAARAVQGAGAAVMMALTMALVGEAISKEKAGSAMGLLGTMSAVGTALGPSLGGIVIAAFGWRAIFLVNVPLGILAFALAYRYLPADRVAARIGRAGFDNAGTLLLSLSLAAYALAMTTGRGNFGGLNAALLVASVVGFGFFAAVEKRAASPLIPLAMFRDPTLTGSLATSTVVATVMMTTLVVGPFYLSGALGLDMARVGLVVSVGPVVVAFAGVPAGRLTDRFGATRVIVAGLVGMAVGSVLLAATPARFGVAGYVVPLVIVTAGYALVQTANNTIAMAGIPREQRGVISGMVNLSRNLGLITGASVMGAVFAFAAGSVDVAAAGADAVAAATRATFAVVTVLIAATLASRMLGRRS